MTRWWRRWRVRHVDTAEAEQLLAQVQARAPEIDRLADELREVQRRNHFSEAVAAAIARTRST